MSEPAAAENEHESKPAEYTVYDENERAAGTWLGQFKAFPDADVLTADERKLTALRLDQITVCEGVFQPRQFLYNVEESVKQVASLKKAIKKRRPVGRLLVWKAGGKWYCLDGHHRLKAYNEVARIGPEWRERLKYVAVKAFVGDKREAHIRSIADNAEDKLPTTFGDKLEAAWRMVLQGPAAFQKGEIANETQTGERTVAEMRMVKRQCEAGEIPRLGVIDPALHTWRELKAILLGLKEPTAQDVKDEAQRKSYVRQFGQFKQRLQGRRCIRLAMEALGNLSAGVLETALQEGSKVLDNIQRSKRTEHAADVEDGRILEDDQGHLEDPSEDF